MADIQYYRILRTPQGGVCGEMMVKGESFFAMENLRPGTQYDSIPPGRYQIKLVKLGERSKGDKGLSLRFIEIFGRGGVGHPFLIHRAKDNNWRTLTGCIAPGMESKHTGRSGQNAQLVDSEKAMDRIIDLLGGPSKEGHVFEISIENVAPGQHDTWTREEFIERRETKRGKHYLPT